MLKISHSIENNYTSHAVNKQTEPYIIFTVDNEEIGVEAQKVLELVKYMAPLKMPNNFANVHGMTIYRGRMIPIIDLRVIFGLEPISYDDNTVTIVLESRVSPFGITAERVLDLNFVPLTAIKKVSAFNFGEKTKYLKSVANFNERLVLLLDLEKMIEIKPTQSELITTQTGLIEEATRIAIPEQSQEESRPASSYLIDPQELEDLLNGNLPEPEQEKEAVLTIEFDPVIEIEQPMPLGETHFMEKSQQLLDPLELKAILVQLEREKEQELLDEDRLIPLDDFRPATFNNTQTYLETDSPKDGLLKPEEIAEVLSDLESDLVADLPEDLLIMETSAEILTIPDQREGQLSNQVIEGILKELESESDSKGQPSESDRKI